MSHRIRTSIHGRLLGLDHRNHIVTRGVTIGQVGSQRELSSPEHISLWDDFIEDGILSTVRWLATEGTDTATIAATPLDGGVGGVLRLTTGDVGTGMAADAITLRQHAKAWNAEFGEVEIQFRVRISQLTDAYVFLGFTDTIADVVEPPIESAESGDIVTSNAADAIGFMFDSRQDTQEWFAVGVANDVDAAVQATGIAPVEDEWVTLRIEVDDDGAALFFINGRLIAQTVLEGITPDVAVTPIMMVSKTATAASMTMDLDYVHITMARIAEIDQGI